MKNRKEITIYLKSEEDKENYFIFKRLIKRDKEVLNISNFFRIKLREYVKNNI